MEREILKKLLRESLLLLEKKKKESKKSKEKAEKEKEDELDPSEKEISDGDASKMSDTFLDWRGNLPEIISCMKTEHFNDGDDAGQRSLFLKKIKPKYYNSKDPKKRVSKFTKEEEARAITCLSDLKTK